MPAELESPLGYSLGSLRRRIVPEQTRSIHPGTLAPHAYCPGALLGVWARPAPTPNKPLTSH